MNKKNIEKQKEAYYIRRIAELRKQGFSDKEIEHYFEQREIECKNKIVCVRMNEAMFQLIRANPSKMIRSAIEITYGDSKNLFTSELNIQSGKLFYNG